VPFGREARSKRTTHGESDDPYPPKLRQEPIEFRARGMGVVICGRGGKITKTAPVAREQRRVHSEALSMEAASEIPQRLRRVTTAMK
jgi:hypothetical protein